MSDVIRADQPVSELQLNQLKVEWVPYASIKPNKYNPNRTTSQDRALLRQSILEDGWTQPIVTLLDGVIVDGEQRWTVAGFTLLTSDVDAIIAKMTKRQEEGFPESQSILSRLHESRRRLAVIESEGHTGTLASITGGLVPVTRVDFGDDAHKMIATIRHNRARGTHNIDRMAEITQDLQQLGLDWDDLEVRLGMDNEEIKRLLETATLAEQIEFTDPSTAWQPVHIATLDEDEITRQAIQRSQAAAEASKKYQLELAERERQIREQQKEQINVTEAHVGPLTQDEKTRMRSEIEAKIPLPPPPPKPPEMRRFSFFVTVPEYDMCMAVLGELPVQGFVRLCREEFVRLTGKEPGV